MNTKIVYVDKDNLRDEELLEGAQLLSEGKTVVFPTETVYGLGANALDDNATDKIYKAKGRPSDNPLIVHIGHEDALWHLISEMPAVAKGVMDKFWPGPLTLIFKKSDVVPNKVTSGLNTVAIRMPSHPLAKRLIELSGVPVAAPSANISGKPSPTTEKHVVNDLAGRVDMIICGGDAVVGVESTVLDLTCDPPMILRPGGVTIEDLREVLDSVDIDPHLESADTSKPKSPGMKYTHYSPEAEVIVVDGEIGDMVTYIKEECRKKLGEGKGIGIIASDETAHKYTQGLVFNVGTRRDLKTVASRLFDALRYFDKEDIDIVYAESFDKVGIGQAIMNRLIKAAGYTVIEV